MGRVLTAERRKRLTRTGHSICAAGAVVFMTNVHSKSETAMTLATMLLGILVVLLIRSALRLAARSLNRDST